MKTVTTIIIVHNQIEALKMCLETVKRWGIENNDIVIVDNASSDGTNLWLKECQDITYVYFDEGKQPYAKLINAVLGELQIESDVFILRPTYFAMPHCMEKMQKVLYTEKKIGIVTALSQGTAKEAESVEEVVEKAERFAEQNTYVRDMGAEMGAVLIKGEILKKIGKLEEKLQTASKAIDDYVLRLTLEDYMVAKCTDAMFYHIGPDIDPFEEYMEDDRQYMKEKWGMHYFNKNYNENLIQLIEEDKGAVFKVLEIGCDCGATLLEIKNRYQNAKVYGIELNPQAAEIAGHFAEVRTANIEADGIGFLGETFDYIIFGDVLEHLHDPEQVLKQCRNFLTKEGKVIASIPNLMHVSVMRQLLNGDFTYTQTGLLDKTHIHFFTYKEIISMFGRSGYQIVAMSNIVVPLDETECEYIDKLMAFSQETQRFMFETFQYLVKAKKKTGEL